MLNFFKKVDSRIRFEIVNLDEKDIHIDFFYKRPRILRKMLGLYTIKVNHYSFERMLRLTDLDGFFPSIKSTIRFPFLLMNYFHQKINKKYIVTNPKPFIVTDAVVYIDRFITKSNDPLSVLEVGAGNSTLWFLKKGCSVLSFEHNKEWAKDIVRHVQNENFNESHTLKVEVCEGREALAKMSDISGEFDIILIDSMNEFTSRYEALKILRNKVSRNGILILDNSDGPVNWKAMQEMAPFNGLRFTGYAHNCPYVSQTTIWSAKDLEQTT